MIPDTSSMKQIRLYKAEKFPLKWKFVCTLINDIDASDTIVIKKKNIWYLLTNKCSCNINDHNSELHIYWSSKLVSNKWNAFHNNPVILILIKLAMLV